jgi:hypothetical protein
LVREDFERRISLLKTLAREDNIQRDLNEIWDLRYSGILGSVKWQSFTDVSGQHIGPIFKGQGEKKACKTLRS